MKAEFDERTFDLLDECRGRGSSRVDVLLMTTIRAVGDVYFERPASVRRLLNYARELGPAATLTKARSRRRERWRNRRYLSIGRGVVTESDADSDHVVGQPVLFVAPCHPPKVNTLVLDNRLICGVKGKPPVKAADARGAVAQAAAEALAGWSPWSGLDPDPSAIDTLMNLASHLPSDERNDRNESREVRVSTSRCPAEAGGQPASTVRIYGFGNYVKTVVLPELPPSAHVVVHEIDPTQIGDLSELDPRVHEWSTCSDLPVERALPELVIAAGFHHTHAATAITALSTGSAVIVEKPAATTLSSLGELVEAARRPGAPPVWLGFHRRYSVFNRMLQEDLAAQPGEPLHYACTAFEEPLPRRHWYTWPNSGGNLVANGCHWIDHFLYLNAFAGVRCASARRPASGAMTHVWMELENGATFSLALTHTGSARLGVRDVVQVFARDRTATLTDQQAYRSESTTRLIRRARVRKLDAHRAMYKSILSQAFDAATTGDDAAGVQMATRLSIELEASLR